LKKEKLPPTKAKTALKRRLAKPLATRKK